MLAVEAFFFPSGIFTAIIYIIGIEVDVGYWIDCVLKSCQTVYMYISSKDLFVGGILYDNSC